MKLCTWILIATTFLYTACKKSSIANGTSACIKQNIEANKNKEVWYVANVEEYKYQGKLVYAFNPDNKVIADGATSILTSKCITLCNVGGFGGPAINLCNGENFYQNAVLVREIWNKY